MTQAALAPVPGIEQRLRKLVFGQDAAIDAIMPALLTHEANLSPTRRPAGSFLLLGPTGVGKTHTVESVAVALHYCRPGQHVIKIDCAEYSESHEVAKLTGAPPGYIGHSGSDRTPPRLSVAALKDVRSTCSALAVVLFDEIEKAHPAVFRLLLGVLDKGEFHTGQNEPICFTNTLVFFTSNLGVAELNAALSEKRMGLPGASAAPTRTDAIAIRAAKKYFSPEFWNRIDEVIVFQPLWRETLAAILKGYVAEYNNMVAERRMSRDRYTLDLALDASTWLLDRGTSCEYGARELRRVFERHVLNRIVRDIRPMPRVTAHLAGGKIALKWRAS